MERALYDPCVDMHLPISPSKISSRPPFSALVLFANLFTPRTHLFRTQNKHPITRQTILRATSSRAWCYYSFLSLSPPLWTVTTPFRLFPHRWDPVRWRAQITSRGAHSLGRNYQISAVKSTGQLLAPRLNACWCQLPLLLRSTNRRESCL